MALFGLAAGCKDGGGPATPPAPPPPKVTVAKPVVRKVQQYREFTGRTDAVENVEVRARVKGFLQKIHFKEGTEAKKLQLLYEIDPREYQAGLDRARANQASSEAQLKLAESELARAGSLRSSNATSQEDYAKRQADKTVAEAAVLQARAAVEEARLQLEFTKIHAPIDGRISRTLVTEGNLVGSGDPTLLTTIRKIKPIYVYFQSPERNILDYDRRAREENLPTATEGKIPVSMALDGEEVGDDGQFPHKGVINWRENRVDSNTGTVMIRGQLDNAVGIIKPGMYARVRVPYGPPADTLLVPESAIGVDQRGRFVMVVGEGNKAQARVVRTGPVQKDGLIIVEASVTADGKPNPNPSLKADETVIINGLQRVRPGAPVDPQPAGQTATAAGQ